MRDKYILEGHTPVPCDDILKWGEWMEDRANRHVAITDIGSVVVSTVFLGLDHSYSGEKPLIFETMVFNCPELGEEQERYSTWSEAVAGHARMVERVKASTT